jgi:hypothetical protein
VREGLFIDGTNLWDLEQVDGAASSLDALSLSLGQLGDVAVVVLVEHDPFELQVKRRGEHTRKGCTIGRIYVSWSSKVERILPTYVDNSNSRSHDEVVVVRGLMELRRLMREESIQWQEQTGLICIFVSNPSPCTTFDASEVGHVVPNHPGP